MKIGMEEPHIDSEYPLNSKVAYVVNGYPIDDLMTDIEIEISQLHE